LSRGAAILAVAVQLPAAVSADEASGVPAIASIAQMADAATFVLTTKPPLSDERGQPKGQTLRLPYKILKTSARRGARVGRFANRLAPRDGQSDSAGPS
jgi:hypothetical protein